MPQGTRRFLFLFFGLTLAYCPNNEKVWKSTSEKLLEPTESKLYRRKLTALSGITVLTGFAGGSPYDLRVFGVAPSESGTSFLLVAIFVVQMYWHFQRHQNLSEDGVIETNPALSPQGIKNPKISDISPDVPIIRKKADLYANYVSFLLMLCSWYFVASWLGVLI